MKDTVFSDWTPCSVVEIQQCFCVTDSLVSRAKEQANQEDATAVSSTLRKGAFQYIETLVNFYRNMSCHNPEEKALKEH
jgi:hypothetical protein